MPDYSNVLRLRSPLVTRVETTSRVSLLLKCQHAIFGVTDLVDVLPCVRVFGVHVHVAWNGRIYKPAAVPTVDLLTDLHQIRFA